MKNCLLSSRTEIFDLHPRGDDSFAHHRLIAFLQGPGCHLAMADAGLQKVGVEQLDCPIVFVVVIDGGQILLQHNVALLPGSIQLFCALGEFEHAALEGVIVEELGDVSGERDASKFHYDPQLAGLLVTHLKGICFAA